MSRDNYAYSILSVGFTIALGAFVIYGILHLMSISAGSFWDWLVGVGTFLWLLTIVVVPWNIHFEAKEVLNEARRSEKKQISFDKSELGYVRRLAVWSLVIALILHIVSALGLYWIAYSQISLVGYFGAGAAILLTFLRPAIRAYEYISYRLSNIKESIAFPQEDVQTLRYDLENIGAQLETLLLRFDEGEENSWINQYQQERNQLKNGLLVLQKHLESLEERNEQAHQKLSQETRHAVAQLNEDGKFIDNIVEIIRFIKKV